MTWPTFPAASLNNFLDHFPGSSLNARWTSVTSGTGAVSVSGSVVDLNAPANSAAFIYKPVEIDKTRSQLWTVAIRRQTGTAINTALYLVNGASAPAADTQANIDGKTLVAGGLLASSDLRATYFDSGNTQQYWTAVTNAWNTTTTNPFVTPGQNDDYYIFGVEIDGVNSRWRMLAWSAAFSAAGTWDNGQGWALTALTDWVNWSATRSNSDVWLVLGNPVNNVGTAMRFTVDWVRYAEAPAGNTVLDAWVAAKLNLADAHQIRHVYSYDGLTFVPDDRTSNAISRGGGAPDDAEINEPRAAWDGLTTDWIFYTGTTGSTKSICCASATHVAAGTGQSAAFSKFAGNPILSLGGAGAFDEAQIGFPFAFFDTHERLADKMWKMLYTGQQVADGKRRMGYATAPRASGPWTKQGQILDVGGSGANDEGAVWGMSAVWYQNEWYVFYEGHDVPGDVARIMWAKGPSFTTLQKQGTLYSAPSGGSQGLTANLTTAPGRTVTVADTTGFVADAAVVICQTSDGDTWSTSRVRTVSSSTQLELYHGLTGFTTTVPAKIRQIDTGPGTTPRHVALVGTEWWFYATFFEPLLDATYFTLLEENHLLTHSNASPSGATPAANYLASPVTSRSGFGNARGSFENMTLLQAPFAGGTLPRNVLRPRPFRPGLAR